MKRIKWDSEEGATLVETLVGITIMAMVVVGIMGSLAVMAAGSNTTRSISDADGALGSWADRVNAATYTSCANATTYAAANVGASIPTGLTTSVTKVEFLSSTVGNAAFVLTCSVDPGVQRITLSITAGKVTRLREVIKSA